MTKICNVCGKEKDIEDFGLIHNKHIRNECITCHNLKKYEATKNSGSYKRNTGKTAQKQKDERKNGINREKYILRDSRKSDKRKGFVNDLTIEIIREIIANMCFYCGDDELKKTLDRIDNNKGHTIDNVVCACIRCNYLRRDMPYEAWLKLSLALKNIRELGLFGDWIGGMNKRKK